MLSKKSANTRIQVLVSDRKRHDFLRERWVQQGLTEDHPLVSRAMRRIDVIDKLIAHYNTILVSK